MSKKLTKKTKVLNLLSKGKNVTWKTLRARFDLNSPTAMIHTLRKEGYAIYRNMTPSGVAFRLGSPTKSMIAAGIVAVLGADQAYKS